MAKSIRALLSSLPLDVWSLIQGEDVQIKALSLDSRKAGDGDLFFAINGENFAATRFVEDVVKKNVSAICCDVQDRDAIQAMMPSDLSLLAVTNLKMRISEIAKQFYDAPSAHMNVTAITGTDGKTSVSHFLAQMYQQSAVVGTMGNGPIDKLAQATHTTPNAIELQALFAEFAANDIQYVAMEASSHGLSQGRMDAVDVHTAVLTSFSRDHLDYHGTLEAYKAAKLRLFKEFSVKNIVINLADALGQEIYQQYKDNKAYQVLAYTLDVNDLSENCLSVKSIKAEENGFVIDIAYGEQREQLSLALLGRFNIENALSVLAVLMLNGKSFAEACSQVAMLKPVKGRMQAEPLSNGLAIIDYAHTPKALASVINAIKEHLAGNLICVFGCGGDRDKGKRALMAKVASTANYVIVTNDNPRTEDAKEIADQICKGFENFSAYELELDREQAIVKALTLAKENDVVLIAGKGHEDYQIIGDKKIAFSDEDVVKNYIRRAA